MSESPNVGISSQQDKNQAPLPAEALEKLSDRQLDVAYDCALADYGLAVKYEHNAHLRPAIEAHLGNLDDEYKRHRFPRRASMEERTK